MNMKTSAIERELKVARSFCSCRGDEERLDEAEAELIVLKRMLNELTGVVEITRPEGCVCDEREWGTTELPPICKEFILDSVSGNCNRCEHDKECHVGRSES